MDKGVAVVAEFGRTPVLNKNAGRDHWPRVGYAFVAGGDMNHGQMIGAADSKVAEPSIGRCISAGPFDSLSSFGD